MYYRDVVHSFKTVPVLVTGAGRGIGKRLAMGFATNGARVGLLARSKPELDLCQLEIEHAGGNALRRCGKDGELHADDRAGQDRRAAEVDGSQQSQTGQLCRRWTKS